MTCPRALRAVPLAPQELPAAVGSFDRELDDVVPVLLKKAGDLSTAGVCMGWWGMPQLGVLRAD
jgi:hypothetical protein